MTFGEYWTTWVERHRRLKDVRKSTLTHYITHHDVHFGEVLDEVRLDRIFVPTIEKVFSRIDEKNAQILAARRSDDPDIRNSVRGKGPTGPVTEQRIRATLRSVLADAMREHLVAFNAAALMHLPTGRKPKGLVWTKARVEAFDRAFAKRLEAVRADPDLRRRRTITVWACADLRPSPVMVWTPAQLGAFLDHAVTDRLYALFHLVAFRGLRRGEACGARWSDLDTDEGTLSVTTQLTVVNGQVEEGAPKTDSSDNLVSLDLRSLHRCAAGGGARRGGGQRRPGAPDGSPGRGLSATRGLPSVSPLPLPPHHPTCQRRNRRSAVWPAPAEQNPAAATGDRRSPDNRSLHPRRRPRQAQDMNISGNTIFIPGATSGIGLALALALRARNNTVIIGGRRTDLLDRIAAENPGLDTVRIDTTDAASVEAAAKQVLARHPGLNVLITMAGIMRIEDWRRPESFLASAEEVVTTNVLGPIRLIAAFVEHLQTRPDATIVTVSSGLAFAPLKVTPSYNASKAAIHMLSESLRLQLEGTGVKVVELEPPSVRTALLPGQEESEFAMPLEEFVAEVVELLETQPDAKEIQVERVKFLRYGEARGDYEQVVAMLNAADPHGN
ncbi:hypothetical protein GCM10009850_119420 [Nonomuraea monospora]|uniref:Uncharacterized protein n=1 Tax=Nonomuraea monospora TaxID=568818 RepID=A0ABN3D425_9ACTN